MPYIEFVNNVLVQNSISAVSGIFADTLNAYTSISSPDINLLKSTSANWNSVYTTVSANSSNWESTYTTFKNASATFLTSETDSQNLSYDESLKEISISNGNTISLSSIDNNLKALSGNWEDTYTTVKNNSALWGVGGGSDISSLTSNWEDTYTTVKNNSGDWSYNGSDIKVLTANWENTYTAFSNNSSSYATNSYVDANFLPLSGGTMTGRLIASATAVEARLNIGGRTGAPAPTTLSSGDVWISNQGVLSYRDGSTSRSVAVTNISNIFNQPQTIGSSSPTAPVLNVSNTSTGQAAIFTANSLSAAVRITQTGTGNSLLIEDDTNPDATPFIIDNLGSVGIGLSSVAGLNAKLTVIGNISGSSVIYASGGNSDIWNLTYSAVSSNSANWISTYNTVSSNSASWSANPQIIEATVHNEDTVPLVRGNVVYTFGAAGSTMSVKLASNTSDTTSSKTLGFVNENIPVGGTGTVTVMGRMENLDFDLPYLEGDALWLGSTPGTYTRTKPVAPNHGVYLGVVERANQGNGIAYIKVQNGYELDEIHDVLITAPLSGQILRRNSANTLWTNTNDGTRWDETYATLNALSGAWNSAPKAFGSEYSFHEQFLNTVSLGGNLNAGTTGGTFTVASSAVFGQAQLSTGATATAGSNARLTSGANQFSVLGSGSLDYAIRFGQSSTTWFDGILTGAFRAGLMISFNTDSTGMYFRAVNGTTLEFVSRIGSTETVLPMGANLSQGNFHLCQFSINSAGNLITVKYNGTQVGTVTTNIPSAGLFHNICIIRDSAIGTAVTANLDFVAMRYIPNTPFFTF